MTKLINPYKPLPWQIPAWRDKTKVLLATGSAGGGKSRFAGEKVHAFCKKYPGATGVIVRKTRESLTNSTLLFFERKIVGNDPTVRHLSSKHRFEYANGSILAYGGMKDEEQREQLRGIGQDASLDFAWMEEATQFVESDLNELLARMRGKASPWTQVLLTCNPDSPQHWIYSRLILGGGASVRYSSASDNPYNPAEYLDTLNSMTGVDKLRLADGKWVQAEGIIYDTWIDAPGSNPKSNVTDEAVYNPDWGSVYWAVDDGFSGKVDENSGLYTANSHPRVFLLAQRTPWGGMSIFHESYAVKTQPEDHIADVEQFANIVSLPRPEFVVIDRAASAIRSRLYSNGYMTRSSSSDVEEGIKEMRRWISTYNGDHPLLIVNPSCRHFRSEMVSYVANQTNGRPVKQFDHGPDACRYLLWCFRYE